ncbi:MAG: DUF92 domain-containing protein [Ignavibacteriaceae bacterium]|nr:DUF92 domain-containing protein [Ignavibacteriaceae bacterium]
MHLLLSISYSFLISVIAFRLKFLSFRGSLAAFFFGAIIYFVGGLKWSVPILFFFFLSSFVTHLRRKIYTNSTVLLFESERRNGNQVLANGVFPILLILAYNFYHKELLYLCYVSAIAGVFADTMATEIGSLSKFKTYDIVNLKQVVPGTSGGISIYGILGGLLASVLLALIVSPWLSNEKYFIIVIVSGFFANLVDSILGSTLQAKYKCVVCLQYTEKNLHCNQNAKHVKGLKYLNNDGVNLITSVTGAFIPALITN